MPVLLAKYLGAPGLNVCKDEYIFVSTLICCFCSCAAGGGTGAKWQEQLSDEAHRLWPASPNEGQRTGVAEGDAEGE